MKKFVVSAPSWFPGSGGLTILHKLVHMLNDLGYDAYLAPSGPSGLGWHLSHNPFQISSKYDKIKLITDEVYSNLQDAIVVYPETWYGNYLNAPNVVRWIMGPVNPKYMTAGSGWGVRWDAWKDSDLWFWYAPLYKTKTFSSFDKNLDNNLYLGEFYREIFYNQNINRTINCWTLRKSTGLIDPKDYIHQPTDVFLGEIDEALPDFDFPGQYHKFAYVLNQTNIFYSYDPYTFVSVQAVMCGADSVVVPRKGLSKGEYYEGHPLHRYLAYGTDELDRARGVRHELNGHLDLIEKESIDQIHKFVQICHDYYK
jgi:hypothetical protein